MKDYKWRENLTLKEKFKSKFPYTHYTCTHNDFGSHEPCQHPSHYEGANIFLSKSELEDISQSIGVLIEEAIFGREYLYPIRDKIKSALDKLEYPYEEGYE